MTAEIEQSKSCFEPRLVVRMHGENWHRQNLRAAATVTHVFYWCAVDDVLRNVVPWRAEAAGEAHLPVQAAEG